MQPVASFASYRKPSHFAVVQGVFGSPSSSTGFCLTGPDSLSKVCLDLRFRSQLWPNHSASRPKMIVRRERYSGPAERLVVRRHCLLRTWLVLTTLAGVLVSCKPDTKVEAPEIRPVRTVTAARGEAAETVVLTGHIHAEDEPALAFRIGGRMIARPVNVGDRVQAGQILAKLDPENELNELRSAESALAAAQGQLTYARGDFERQRQLLANGHTPRARFDQSQNALQNAQSQVDNTE